MAQGATENTPIVSPMSNCNQDYLYQQPTIGVPGPTGPQGEKGDPGAAVFTSQAPRQMTSGLLESYAVTISGLVLPTYGTAFETEISTTPFGTDLTTLGVQVQLLGYGGSGQSQTNPVILRNSRDVEYGIWTNGTFTLFEGYLIQLQLMEIGGIKLWRELFRNS